MANVTRYDPFNELVDDFFKGFFVRPLGFEPRPETPRMKVEVAEKNGSYLVTAELPGVSKEDIQVTVDGAQVTLAAEVKRRKEIAEADRVLASERSFGKVIRSFTLPQDLDETKVEAKFTDGVLELALPKKAQAERRRITIQ